MGKIVVSQFITLDGVVQDPGGSESFAHGGWSFQALNDEYFNYKHSELFSCDALLLGRVTFQSMEKAQPTRSDVTGFLGRLDSLPKHVVSTTLGQAAWSNSTVIKPPILPAIHRLRHSYAKDILVVGSRTLVRSLIQHDLVDEYRLMIHPVVLGAGHKLFDEGAVRKLKLIGTRPFATGVVVLTYVPDRSRIVEMKPTSSFGQASSSSR